MSVDATIGELRARLALQAGAATLLLVVAESEAVLEETARVLLAVLSATPIAVVDLGACKSDMGPARWAERTQEHASAEAFMLRFVEGSALAVAAFARRLNAERQWLRGLAGPVVMVVSRATERALRQHAQDFITWVAHSYELPAPRELVAAASRLGVASEAVAPVRPPESPVRFLHISDLHLRQQFSKRYDQDRVLDGLLSFLERDRAGFPVDLMFVTGDLAQAGKAEEYALVSELLAQVMARTGVPAERVFVVPGNHDVDREVGRWLLRTLSGDEESTVFFEDPRSRVFHAKKLAAYKTGMQALLGATRPLGLGVGEDSVEIVEIRGARIAIAGFNSAWFAQGDDDREKLWVGEANVMRAMDKIADEEAPFAIAMLHHPFEDLHPVDRESVEPWLERGFDLVLRGHLHANKTRSIMSQRGGFVEVAAPAAFQGSKWANGCFLGEIRAQARTIRLRPYMYTAGPDPWVLDTRVFPDDEKDGYCHTFVVPAKTRVKSAVGRPLRAATAAAMRAMPQARQQEIIKEVADITGLPVSGSSAANLLGNSPDLWRVIAAKGDPGIEWVSAINSESLKLGAPGAKVVVCDIETLEETLHRASKLFLRTSRGEPRLRLLAREVIDVAFVAAVAAVVDGRVSQEVFVTGPDAIVGVVDLLIESPGGGRFVIEMKHSRPKRGSLHLDLAQLDRYLSRTEETAGALVLFDSPHSSRGQAVIERVKSPAGHTVLVVHL